MFSIHGDLDFEGGVDVEVQSRIRVLTGSRGSDRLRVTRTGMCFFVVGLVRSLTH